MATPDPGPIGSGVLGISGTKPPIVQTRASHGLADGERVRLGSDDAFALCYVKSAANSTNEFAAYSDPGLKTFADIAHITPTGSVVVRLAAADWAIVVGINLYNHPGLRALQGPARDAELFAQWVKHSAYVPDDQVELVQSSPILPTSLADAGPGFDRVTEAFKKLAVRADQKDFHHLGRRLYLFLSGHGIVPTLSAEPDYRDAALLTANADPYSLGRHIRGRAYAEWFRGLGIFDEVILFQDCCRDEKSNVPPTIPVLPGWKRQTSQEGRQFYAAPTQFGSKSWEQPLGSPAEVRGVFSYALIEALNNPTLYDPTSGCLTGSVLEKHLYTSIPSLNDKQSPAIDYPHDPTIPEIVFAKRAAPKQLKARITFDAKYAGLIAKIYLGTDTKSALQEHPVDGNSWDFPVTPNCLYKVAVEGTESSVLFESNAAKEVISVHVP